MTLLECASAQLRMTFNRISMEQVFGEKKSDTHSGSPWFLRVCCWTKNDLILLLPK